MPGKISITEEEFRGLCAKYTREEIAQMKGATVNWVWSKTKKYGIKPVVVCKRCQKRFTPKGREEYCPSCRTTPIKERNRPAHKPEMNIKKSNAFEIERQMREQGRSYADYQKAKTIEEFARVKVTK